MSKNGNRIIKSKGTKNLRILSLLVIVFSLTFITSLINLDINANLVSETYTENGDFQISDLNTQDLNSDNAFTGVGNAWNVTHYANYTKSNLGVSFNNNSYDDSHAQVELYEWNGYQLNSTITDLYDTRNWINGTFNAGFFGGSPSGSDDSDYISDWDFKTSDIQGYINTMSGNYYDGSTSTSDYESSLQLRINADGSGRYDVGDKCWWENTIAIDRGDVDEAWLSFAVRPYYGDAYNNHMVLQVLVNNKIVWGNGLQSMIDASGNPSGQWYEPYPIFLDGNDDQLFPTGLKNMNVTLEFKRVSGTASGYASSYSVLFDNVSLIVKAKAKPSQLELELNNEYVNDNANYGEGNLGILGNWNGSLQSTVIANYSSNAMWSYKYQDDGNWISYKVELITSLNLFTTKSSPETYYTADSNLQYQGSSFITSNNSNTNWTTYAHMEVPAGYEETNLTVEYPSDYNLTGVFLSLNPNSLSQVSINQYGNKKIANIPVSSITSNTNGFWKLTAVSPNYCTEMGMFNNATGAWEGSNMFFSGDYINITAKINNSQLISGYIQQTNAQLQIRFPNGTIWAAKSQIKPVYTTGMVSFNPILIPFDEPNYEVGEFQAIVSWNNSYSSFNLNETGIIYKSFTVKHNSSLIPDEYYYPNIYEEDSVNLKVSFFDPKNNKPIEGANVYLTNFTGGTQYFNEINPGYYLLLFNTSGGVPGENNLTIYATHPLYQNTEVDITIEVTVYTSLTAEEYPSLEVPWNNNFTIHLGYTVISDDSGIENVNPTVFWNDDWSIQSGNGLYNITCNTSRYQINTAPNLRIVFDKSGYESQTIIISIGIVERQTYVDEIFINNNDCSANKSYNVHSGELINITLKYNDYEGGILIHNAEVTLNGTGIGEIFTDNTNFYNLTIDSTQLGLGISFLNIIAQKNNYTAITELLTITVYERDTDYLLYLDKAVQGQNPSIQLYKNHLLNITISYTDLITMEHIPNAIVDINGSGISELLQENFDNYSILIDTDDLNQGVNFLTIFVRKDGYEPHSISLIIEIIQIETDLTLFLDGADSTADPSIQLYDNQLLNITISYTDLIAMEHIPTAIVDINGSGISELLVESFNNYTVVINTVDLNQGVNFLTIFVRKDGYEPQTISLIIEIIQIETDLTLFLDGADSTADPSIQRYNNQLLNITISYTDLIAMGLITNATVDINGSGISELFVESFNNYTVVINTVDLNQGVNFLTIYARKKNYEPQTILLIIEIIEKETELTLLIDGDPNPFIGVTIGNILNITVFYTDTGSPITGALVQLIGEVDTLNFSAYLNHYSIYLNTADLTVGGVSFFTIAAYKTNFQRRTIDLRITINPIKITPSTLSGETIITGSEGDTVHLSIILNNTNVFPSGELFKNATVTYKWDYGQGAFQETDGIYKADLVNVPSGTYIITITASTGDVDYDFETFEITLIVGTVTPPDFSMLFIIVAGALVGLVSIFALYELRFKYPAIVRKSRKIRKKIKKGRKTKPIKEIASREDLIKKHLESNVQTIQLEKKTENGLKGK